MNEPQRIADQLRRAHEGDAWHGPALDELLNDVAPPQASRRPISGAHSIWEIVEHVAVWESIARRRMAGEIVTHVPPEVDWPPVSTTTNEAWKATLARLGEGYQRLRQAIAEFPEAHLEEKVPGMTQTVYHLLHGVVQHTLYHAGQIALLKKFK